MTFKDWAANEIKLAIEHKNRLCKVKDRIGYFHCWEQYADVIRSGLAIGLPDPGGQFARVCGIVEFTDGVERVDPLKIKFIDEENADLHYINKTEE